MLQGWWAARWHQPAEQVVDLGLKAFAGESVRAPFTALLFRGYQITIERSFTVMSGKKYHDSGERIPTREWPRPKIRHDLN
jgi:hypothetical protein